MPQSRGHYFSLHQLLIMAALAALGGVIGSVVSLARAAIHAVVVLPVGMQFLAGIHLLAPIVALGLVRKPGAATVTAVLMGTVELLAGSPHGLIVYAYTVSAGIAVDLVWLLLGGRHHLVTYVLAGGVGATTNVLVLKYVILLPGKGLVVNVALALMAGMAFVSGAVLAGLLGWSLLGALQRAGVVGARPEAAPARFSRAPAWTRAGVVAALLVVAVLTTHFARGQAGNKSKGKAAPAVATGVAQTG